MGVPAQRPSPGRRRTGIMGASMTMFPLLLMLLSVIGHALAYDIEFDEREYNSGLFQELAQTGQIHIDTSEPPPRPQALLERRQDAVSTDTSDTTTLASSPTTSSSTTPSPVVIATPIPSPFDTSLGSNFTAQSCPNFFATFLANSTFKACIPVSLLLQNSNSFFRAERSPDLLAETLAAACNAPLPLCVPIMANLAAQLIRKDNCKDDYDKQNPLVRQAYNGLLAYEPIYRATCLQTTTSSIPATNDTHTPPSNPKTEYCFSLAVSNRSNPADAYPYYTALGLPLPSSSQPTCSQCLKQTMAIFSAYASDSTSPLSQTYMGCAQMVDSGCGSGFANTTVKVVSTSDAGRVREGNHWKGLLITLALGVVVSGLL